MAGKIRQNVQYQIDEANHYHKGKYDYSKVVYKKFDVKVIIGCPIHGDFEQRLYEHSKGQGCKKCAINLVSKSNAYTQEQFISIVKNKYPQMCFDETIYINAKTKVTIKCPKHGYYSTGPRQLLIGSGCYKCGRESAAKYGQEHPALWSKRQWAEGAIKSKNFDSFKVYILLCENENEIFYKIGRTFTTVKHRYRHPSYLYYNYIIYKEFIFSTAKEAHEKETELKNLHKKFKYVPLVKFGGRYECFSDILI